MAASAEPAAQASSDRREPTSTAASAEPAAQASSEGREVEWQMATSDLAGVRHWVTAQPAADGWIVEPTSAIELHDTYLDTADWRIYRAGMTLRVRDAGGQPEATLKELHSARHDVADRRELTEPLPEARLDVLSSLTGPVGARLHEVTGVQSLRPLFVIHTSRERFHVRRPDSKENLGEVALDDTRITSPDGTARTTLQRVEVEASGANSEPLEDFIGALRRECPVEPATDSKYALGLRAVGLAPATGLPLAPREIDAAMGIREVAFSALGRYLTDWRVHEPAVRLGEEPEALHDLRVAGRRIDAALSLFEAALPRALARLRPALKQRIQSLGEARDLDIALLQLEHFAQDVAPKERQALDPVRRHLVDQRAQAQRKVLSTLNAVSTQRLLARLEAGVTAPVVPKSQSNELAVVAAPALLRNRYRKLRKAMARITRLSTAEERHAVRGRVKKFRYAVESVADLYGKPAAALLRTLRRLQHQMGEEHDAHQTRERLRALSERPRKGFGPTTLFLLGQMAERQGAAGPHGDDDARRDRARRQLRKRWKRLRHRFEATDGSRRSGSPPR
jgi:triphosphatase